MMDLIKQDSLTLLDVLSPEKKYIKGSYKTPKPPAHIQDKLKLDADKKRTRKNLKRLRDFGKMNAFRIEEQS